MFVQQLLQLFAADVWNLQQRGCIPAHNGRWVAWQCVIELAGASDSFLELEKLLKVMMRVDNVQIKPKKRQITLTRLPIVALLFEDTGVVIVVTC